MAFMENFMMASGTDWMAINQMSKLPASDQKHSPCTCSALSCRNLLDSSLAVMLHLAYTFKSFLDIPGSSHMMLLMVDAGRKVLPEVASSCCDILEAMKRTQMYVSLLKELHVTQLCHLRHMELFKCGRYGW